ncbi:HlyD family secretion protein [Cerasicoccus arenae]|uniref:MFP transporter n=1 Tax=Cerasicoccus arenae TaxID=424488 RepID=A0A8J3GEL8_9BACT|nr:HlyD family secretion protein [Cerasicoccus arenae]MBK1858791.1 HlyD family secretion protein [Cerasicoccus arenae]GHC04558.1 MFP transporter [Cerasicoccus arenae]
MELLVTIAYYFFIRLIFFDYKLLRFNLFWKFIVIGLYCMAALTEILFLGQFTPYSKFAFVQSYVVQMAPEYGGMVEEVYVHANENVKKGDPLFKMNPESLQDKVKEYEAQLVLAKTTVASLEAQVAEAQARVGQAQAQLALSKVKLAELSKAKQKNAVSTIRIQQEEQNVKNAEAQLAVDQAELHVAEVTYDAMLDDQHAQVAEIEAQLATAKYNLKHTVIRAPSDGYVPNMQLYPGAFTRIKQPIMPFVNSEEHWIVGNFDQRGMQHVQVGDKAEVAFEMYPGQVFEAEVVSIAWASAGAQGIPSGQLPNEWMNHPSLQFAMRLKLTEENPKYPMHFGASALIAVYTKDTSDVLILIRQLEIRSESFLNYLFNPF